MIKNSLQRQIDEQLDLGCRTTEIIDHWFDDYGNEDFVVTLIKNGLKKKFD